MSEEIVELAHIRNRLASGYFNEDDQSVLDSVRGEILRLNSPFKEIAISALDNCRESIKNNQLDFAVAEIQLIHNFTFNNPAKWNSDYFYKVELLSYLEQVDDVGRIKRLISFLAKLQNAYDSL